jgi:hypothetical protein
MVALGATIHEFVCHDSILPIEIRGWSTKSDHDEGVCISATRMLIAPRAAWTKSNTTSMGLSDQIELAVSSPGQAAEIGPFSA